MKLKTKRRRPKIKDGLTRADRKVLAVFAETYAYGHESTDVQMLRKYLRYKNTLAGLR